MEKINLWDIDKIPLYDNTIEQDVPSVTPYIKDGAKVCVVVCPGGAYHGLAYHEGEPVAKWLNSIGVSAFVLTYRRTPYKFPCPQYDAKRAVRYARYCADKYGYDKEKIGILGFSAGGHLAGSTGTIFDDFSYEKQDIIDKESNKPDFMILCYPVVSLVSYAHVGSRYNLMGDVTNDEAEKLSIELNVSKDTCPAFIWHTVNDQAVPVENSLNLALQLSKYSIPYELHLFKDGCHGLGLAEDKKDVNQWTELCKKWLEDQNLI